MIDRKKFYDHVREKPFGGTLLQTQVDGINAIFDEWEKRKPDGDLRWLAYMLATVKIETAHTMKPIHEYGGDHYFFQMYDKAGDRPSVAEALGNTNAGDGVRYHGRGYVQLTGRANYQKLGMLLGLDLVNNPDWALKPDVAAAIMFKGMELGLFTGVGLPNYFGPTMEDWRHARRIINSMDRADEIAAIGREFYAAIMAGGGSNRAVA